MLNFLYKLALTFGATSMVILVFFINKKYNFHNIFTNCPVLSLVPDIISYIIYFLFSLGVNGFFIWLSRYKGVDSFSSEGIDSVECSNNSFMPTYLGYFFVSTGISDVCTFCFVYLIIFIFTFFSGFIYFNPFFVLFGYNFYNIKTKKGSVVSLVSPHCYKNPFDIDIKAAHRINDYTYIEKR